MKSFYQLSVEERPREKFNTFGIEVLNDAELLAVMLGKGSKNKDVYRLAEEILPIIERYKDNQSALKEKLLEIKGIGLAKLSLILAALEFSRRRIVPSNTVIRSPEDIYTLLKHLAFKKQEHFLTVSLNGANEVISVRTVTIGLVSSTQVHPREVFSDSIVERASSLIVVHNHPSGSLEPSEEDKRVTETLQKAGKILGIKLLDHIIISSRGYFSLLA